MPEKILLDDVTGDLTGDSVAITGHEAEIYVKSGTFTSLSFEVRKYDGDWFPLLYSSDGSQVDLTAGTNQLGIYAPINTGRSIRAVVAGAVDLTVGIDEGA